MSRKEFLERYSYNPEVDHLGSGGSASVFKAYDNVLDQEVAIKIAPYRPGTKTLEDEFNAIKHLDHHKHISNYKKVYRITMDTGIAEFAVMQYYPEGSGKSLIHPNVSKEDKIEVAQGLISGVEFLHRNHVIHRDLKWGNILISHNPITKKKVLKIADFGLSKRVEENHETLIDNSINAGTLSYLPPENFKKFVSKDQEVLGDKIKYNYDLWAVGIMLYELFMGRVPFPIDNNDPNTGIARTNQINTIIEAKLPSDVATIDEPYQSIIRKCLIKNPFDRVSSARILLDMINNSGSEDTIFDTPRSGGSDGGENTLKGLEKLNLKGVAIACITLATVVLLAFMIPKLQTINGKTQQREVKGEDIQDSNNSIFNQEAENHIKTFIANFNRAEDSDAKYRVYLNSKETLSKYIKSTSQIVKDDVIVSFDNMILKHANLLLPIELVSIEFNPQGEIKHLFVK